MRILVLVFLAICAGVWAQPPLGPYVEPKAKWITSGSLIIGLEASTDTVAIDQVISAAQTIWDWGPVDSAAGYRSIVSTAGGLNATSKSLIKEAVTSGTTWQSHWDLLKRISPGTRARARELMILAAHRTHNAEITRLSRDVDSRKLWQTLIKLYQVQVGTH